MTNIDKLRTEQLNLPGYSVLKDKGDATTFYIISDFPVEKGCPDCHSRNVKYKSSRERTFIDSIRSSDAPVINIVFKFSKYKCLDCGRVYYPPVSFAAPYSRTTYRFDDMIVRAISTGKYSYQNISEELGGAISRQVVGQIFLRRCKELHNNPPV